MFECTKEKTYIITLGPETLPYKGKKYLQEDKK